MWFLIALCSALFLGFYDVAKKLSLRENAVIPVLFLNTLFSSLAFLPIILGSLYGVIDSGSLFYVYPGPFSWHVWVMLKAALVLGSWVCGYFAIKHLPLTLVGPINSTRPVMVVIGALLIFDEQLNLWQWAGVVTAVFAFWLLSRSGKREGIVFTHNAWFAGFFRTELVQCLSDVDDDVCARCLAMVAEELRRFASRGFCLALVNPLHSTFSLHCRCVLFPCFGV